VQQVKLFKGVEKDCAGLERDINAWLKSSGARVVHMFGNIAPQTTSAEARGAASSKGFESSDLFVAIVYELDAKRS
jgi:hypothetical protein